MIKQSDLGRRLIWPFVFTVTPAIPISMAAARVLLTSESWSILIHPLGILFVVIGLVLLAAPVRLAPYIFSLRERSPVGKKVWAALLCALPASLVFSVVPAVLEQGFTLQRILFVTFFGSYLAAFALLSVHVACVRPTR